MKIDFEDKELDLLVNALAAQPWQAVNGLIQKIVAQANEAKNAPPAEVVKRRPGRPPKAAHAYIATE